MNAAPEPTDARAGSRLAAVVKAHDVRGRVPDDLDETRMRALGAGVADVLVRGEQQTQIVVGRDMRLHSPVLAAALCRGLVERGTDVIDIGLASTDQLYFASGSLDLPGVMVTASHNPPEWNGLKLCRAGARPVGRASGLDQVAARGLVHLNEVAAGDLASGSIERRDVLAAYARHLRALAPVGGRRLRVVVDAANAMAGVTAPAVLGALDLELVALNFELDGSFPAHPPDPLDPANLVDLQAAVRAERADLGLAFDGDADRCFVVDETGAPISASAVIALVARRELARHPGATIVHSLTCSRAVAEEVRAAGGVPVRTRVGHSGVKAAMADHGAVFGGEHSGHYYFAAFWNADSGMLAALHMLAAVAESPRPLSALVAPFDRYPASGEINSVVSDAAAAIRAVEAATAAEPSLEIDHLDGLTVASARWWFNLRASNTESLLRLNVEADDEAMMVQVRDLVLSAIRRQQ
ncbi:MAG: phosphomannomutase/phosphoglucomutase [Nocardioidaceae bacterium]